MDILGLYSNRSSSVGIFMFVFFSIEQDKFCYLNQYSRPIQVFKILIILLKMMRDVLKADHSVKCLDIKLLLTQNANSVGKK